MKTKSILFSVITAVAISGFASVSAVNVDLQIEDELNKKEQQEMVKKAQDLNEKITFTKVNSCKSMETVMSGFLETYRKLHPQRTTRYWDDYDYVFYENSASLDWAAPEAMTNSISAWVSKSASADSIRWGTASLSADMWTISDYSTTNIQKLWVDEPELLKSNGKYLFYYSEVSYKDRYISIIKTPTKKDLSDAEIVAKINIPDSLNDIQLFLNGDKLVILGSRYASKSDSILW